MGAPESNTTGKYGLLEDRICQCSILWLLHGILVVGWCIPLEGGGRQDSSQQACRPVEKVKQPCTSPKKVWDVGHEILTGVFSLSLTVFLSLEDGNIQ